GFVEGYAIIQNRTQKEWGGGLCQVSTTVFRAAFWGGLPISERHEHSFRIGWYEELGEPPGLDAAIFTGAQDMRFSNDTGGWLLMQSAVDLQRQQLSIAIYGAPTGRSVAMGYTILERTPAPTAPVYVDDPAEPAGSLRKSDTARGGLRVDVYRAVRLGDRLLSRDTFATTFKPWPDIFVRGTKP
ncbi:MAG: VanW family protein, partial [Chloroflexales bacterium]